MRAAAARACGRRGWRDAVPALGGLLDDADAVVRAATLRALDELGTPAEALDARPPLGATPPIPRDGRVPPMLARLLKDLEPAVRAEALAALPRHGVPGVKIAREHVAAAPEAERATLVPLLERGAVLALRSDDAQHRRAAIEALHAHACTSAVRSIIARLRDSDPQVREAAMAAVVALAPAEGLRPLLARLDDPDRNAAARAVEALMVVHASGVLAPADVDALHARLLTIAAHGEGRQRVAAAWALGEMGRIGAVATLIGLLDAASEDVVTEACGALERLRDARGVDELCAIARDAPWPRARAAAARALGATGDVRAVAVLVDRLLREPEQAGVEAADEALAAICRPVEDRAREGLASADAAERLSAIEGVRGDIRATRLLLASILDAPDQAAREAAVAALRELGFSAASMAEAALRVPDQPEEQRLFALALVAALQPAGLPALVGGVLRDENEPPAVHLQAVSILASQARPEARTQLESLREHPAPSVREAIARALSPPAAS